MYEYKDLTALEVWRKKLPKEALFDRAYIGTLRENLETDSKVFEKGDKVIVYVKYDTLSCLSVSVVLLNDVLKTSKTCDDAIGDLIAGWTVNSIYTEAYVSVSELYDMLNLDEALTSALDMAQTKYKDELQSERTEIKENVHQKGVFYFNSDDCSKAWIYGAVGILHCIFILPLVAEFAMDAFSLPLTLFLGTGLLTSVAFTAKIVSYTIKQNKTEQRIRDKYKERFKQIINNFKSIFSFRDYTRKDSQAALPLENRIEGFSEALDAEIERRKAYNLR